MSYYSAPINQHQQIPQLLPSQPQLSTYRLQQTQQPKTQNIVTQPQSGTEFIHKCDRYYIEKVLNNNVIRVIKHVKLPKLDSQNLEIEFLGFLMTCGLEFNIAQSIDCSNEKDIQIYTEYQEHGAMSNCIQYWERYNQPVIFSV